MLRFHDLLLARRDEVLDIVQWETGKARRDAMEELLDVCINARHYARDARRLLRPRHHRGVLPRSSSACDAAASIPRASSASSLRGTTR